MGTADGRRMVEATSIGNMKRTWTHLEDGFDPDAIAQDEALRESVQTKNIWIPFGA